MPRRLDRRQPNRRSAAMAVVPWLVIVGLAGCGGGSSGDPIDAGPGADGTTVRPPLFAECDAGEEAFVRSAMLAIVGRRPISQSEVDVYVDLYREAERMGAAHQTPGNPDPKDVVARALTREPGYFERWSDHLLDAIRVPRIEDQSMESCYGRRQRSGDNINLAAYVRDNDPTAAGDGKGAFTMLDLVRSSLALDDVSPIYRGHLFALVSRPIPAANVPRIEAELARREDFGLVFDSAYLNRDLVCLACHNSQDAVTFHPDPTLNRHWALPGLVEKSLYGRSTGAAPAQAHAPFRFDGFVADLTQGEDGQTQPWKWSASCGGFSPSGLGPDPANISAVFGTLEGSRTTVYDLEASLARGFAAIRGRGPAIDAGGEVADADQAFAYMVSATFVESVWREVIGGPLTIANYFARNEAARDELQRLTEVFMTKGFSLRELLIAIVTGDYFNRAAPEAGCGATAYDAPPIYDPWTTADPDPTLRGNGAGDAVAALSGRSLMTTAYRALEWPAPRFSQFPEVPGEYFFCQQFGCGQMQNFCDSQGYCCVSYDLICGEQPGPGEPTSAEERAFQRGIGAFLKNGERGFRGLDFQARLVWEERFAACRNPSTAPDFIDGVLSRAATNSASIADVIIAIKDRLIGEAAIVDDAERTALEALFDGPLDGPASAATNLQQASRRLCGVLLSSPQFLLSAIPGRGGQPPALTPPAGQAAAICERLTGVDLGPVLAIECINGQVRLRADAP